MKTLLICQVCYGIAGCVDERGKRTECVNCTFYLRGMIPCLNYIEARQVKKEYICIPCLEEIQKRSN